MCEAIIQHDFIVKMEQKQNKAMTYENVQQTKSN
jgi:hypothetical protein